MQQPTRYYISRSGDEPTLRSVRISQSQTECARSADSELANADARATEAGDVLAVTPEHGATVKERLQEAIRKRSTAQ